MGRWMQVYLLILVDVCKHLILSVLPAVIIVLHGSAGAGLHVGHCQRQMRAQAAYHHVKPLQHHLHAHVWPVGQLHCCCTGPHPWRRVRPSTSHDLSLVAASDMPTSLMCLPRNVAGRHLAIPEHSASGQSEMLQGRRWAPRVDFHACDCADSIPASPM